MDSKLPSLSSASYKDDDNLNLFSNKNSDDITKTHENTTVNEKDFSKNVIYNEEEKEITESDESFYSDSPKKIVRYGRGDLLYLRHSPLVDEFQSSANLLATIRICFRQVTNANLNAIKRPNRLNPSGTNMIASDTNPSQVLSAERRYTRDRNLANTPKTPYSADDFVDWRSKNTANVQFDNNNNNTSAPSSAVQRKWNRPISPNEPGKNTFNYENPSNNEESMPEWASATNNDPDSRNEETFSSIPSKKSEFVFTATDPIPGLKARLKRDKYSAENKQIEKENNIEIEADCSSSSSRINNPHFDQANANRSIQSSRFAGRLFASCEPILNLNEPPGFSSSVDETRRFPQNTNQLTTGNLDIIEQKPLSFNNHQARKVQSIITAEQLQSPYHTAKIRTDLLQMLARRKNNSPTSPSQQNISPSQQNIRDDILQMMANRSNMIFNPNLSGINSDNNSRSIISPVLSTSPNHPFHQISSNIVSPQQYTPNSGGTRQELLRQSIINRQGNNFYATQISNLDYDKSHQDDVAYVAALEQENSPLFDQNPDYNKINSQLNNLLREKVGLNTQKQNSFYQDQTSNIREGAPSSYNKNYEDHMLRNKNDETNLQIQQEQQMSRDDYFSRNINEEQANNFEEQKYQLLLQKQHQMNLRLQQQLQKTQHHQTTNTKNSTSSAHIQISEFMKQQQYQQQQQQNLKMSQNKQHQPLSSQMQHRNLGYSDNIQQHSSNVLEKTSGGYFVAPQKIRCDPDAPPGVLRPSVLIPSTSLAANEHNKLHENLQWKSTTSQKKKNPTPPIDKKLGEELSLYDQQLQYKMMKDKFNENN